jgi:hypothetical protein
MHALLNFIILLGGLAAAAAVAGMCVVTLLVWMAGWMQKEPSEAWRPADEA